MGKFIVTMTLSAAIVAASLVGSAQAAPTAREITRPAATMIDAGSPRADHLERLERSGDARPAGAPDRVACENGCALPAYTRE